MGRILETRQHHTTLFANKLTNDFASNWNWICKYWSVNQHLLEVFLEIQIRLVLVTRIRIFFIFSNEVVFQVYSPGCWWWQLCVIWVAKGVSSNEWSLSGLGLDNVTLAENWHRGYTCLSRVCHVLCLRLLVDERLEISYSTTYLLLWDQMECPLDYDILTLSSTCSTAINKL